MHVHLPLLQLLTELDLLLDRLFQLAVRLQEVYSRPGQLYLHAIFPSYRLIAHLVRLRHDLVFRQLGVLHVAPGPVALFLDAAQFSLAYAQFARQFQKCVRASLQLLLHLFALIPGMLQLFPHSVQLDRQSQLAGCTSARQCEIVDFLDQLQQRTRTTRLRKK